MAHTQVQRSNRKKAKSAAKKKTTPKTKQVKIDADIENWFLAHEGTKKQGKFPVRSPDVVNFLNFIWPVANTYYSPLNPIFSAECLDVEFLNVRPVWVIRDGLVPLLWFFHTNPKPPKGLKSKILVHYSLAPFVPNAWRAHAGTYEIASSDARLKTATDKFLLMGILMETFCSLKHLEKQLKQVRSTIGKDRLKNAEILAFLPGKFDGFGNEHHHEFHSQFVIMVTKYLGSNIRAVSWRVMEAMEDFSEYQVIEFNEHNVFSDSYLLHYPLNRGAKLFTPNGGNGSNGLFRGSGLSSKVNERFISLSPHHGMKIRERLTGSSVLEDKESGLGGMAKYLHRFEDAMRSEANKRYPWPLWFAQWTRAVANQK